VKREAFLARVAAALGRDESAGPPPLPAPPDGAVVSPSTAGLVHADLVARFVERATAVGVRVHRAADDRAAVALLAALLSDLGTSACHDDTPLAAEAVRAAGAPIATPEHADVGVTGAWRAVAETGTVVLRSEVGRLEGLLPPVHVVVAYERDVRAGLSEVYADLEGALPSGLVQITGPSRTADIELTLTTGVHGPGTVVVVLVGEAPVGG
jgi:L-lactate dehydrogenase complex protein LldG